MLKNIILFIVFLASLGLAFGASFEREYLFLFWLPLPAVLALLYLIFKKRIWFAAAALLLTAASLFKAYDQQIWISSSAYVGAFFIMAFLIENIQSRIAEETKMNLMISRKSRRSLNVMKKRYDAEEAKIRDFQGKVNSLAKLFDVAKDFNTCLTFESLLETIQKSVLSFLKCSRFRLLLLPSDLVGRRGRGFQISENMNKPWLEGVKIPRETLDRLKKVQEVQRIADSSELNAFEALMTGEEDNCPFWVFPIKIEQKTIALFFVEGVREQDFYYFRIVAGQLALQIQKTLLYEKVHSLSLYDGLTQVYVRRHLEERLEEEIRRTFAHGLELSVLMLDLDHFKPINDRFGHLIGDRILKEVADTIRNRIRTVDLIGRYGGEEFIVVLPETNKKGSLEAGERIRSAVAKKRFKVYDDEIRVTVSIGTASFREDLSLKEKGKYDPKWKRELIDVADSALYLAKDDGRNQVKSIKK